MVLITHRTNLLSVTTKLLLLRNGTAEIGLAVMATTFTILAVFLPVGFMTGIVPFAQLNVAEPIVTGLFQRGAFSARDTAAVAGALAGRAYVQAQKFGVEIAIPAPAGRLICDTYPLQVEMCGSLQKLQAKTVVLSCGARYRRPLDWVAYPAHGKHEMIVAEEFVTAEDGSGVVHMSPAFGADDYAAGQRHDLAFLQPVGARGEFPDDMPLESKMVTRGIQSAQSQVEARNFEIRKNVLKYDDVLSRQRSVIYAERKRVLAGEALALT